MDAKQCELDGRSILHLLTDFLGDGYDVFEEAEWVAVLVEYRLLALIQHDCVEPHVGVLGAKVQTVRP